MIYLDNAATTFPKPGRVIDAVNTCLKKYCGNPGRSAHRLSVRASEEIYAVREAVSTLIGAEKTEGVVFTYNATHALNLAIKTKITEKCHVLVSDVEHNSVIRPLEKLKSTLGVDYSLFSSDSPEESISALVRDDTRFIISTLASNVTGEKIPLDKLSLLAERYDLGLIVDASQAIGHTDINLMKTPCDVLCAPAHKALFGIQGCGFAVFADTKRSDSFIEGGSGSDSINTEMPELLPEGYEAGTLSTPAIAALGGGISFINDVGIGEIERKLCKMTDMLKERIISVKGTVLYPSCGGIVSFNLRGYPSAVVARELDKYGICVRGGLHCAPSAHRRLATLDKGTVRLSLSYLNSERELDGFYKALRNISLTYSSV